MESYTLSFLKKLKLSISEIRAYVFLLKKGTANPEEISLSAEIPLTRVYTTMNQLINKELITVDKLSNPITYAVKDPSITLLKLKEKVEEEEKLKNKKWSEEASAFILKAEDIYRKEAKDIIPVWEVYHGESVVYKQIVELLKGSRDEVLMLGSTAIKTMSEEFITEFINYLNCGGEFRGIVTPEDELRVLKFSIRRIIDIKKFGNIVLNNWGKNLFLRKSSLDKLGVVGFGVFDKSRVAFSIPKPISKDYFITLMTNHPEVVGEFRKIFEDLWNSSEEVKVPDILARLIRL